MQPSAFLIVDEQPISLEQALKYLQSSGKIGLFIGEILRQYVLERELQQEDVEINSALTEQAVIDFRIQNQLTDPKRFQEWLASNQIDYPAFHKQVANGFKLANLKSQVVEPKIQEYFIERKLFLDRVVLSRLIIETQELAEELYSQITEEGANFEQLAREYSITEDRIANGMMGPISRGTLPDKLRAAIDLAKVGELVGPIEVEGRWGVFRVEQFLPASLEDSQLKEALKNELFEQWLGEKIQKMSVKLQVK